jgi:hypothetical protein
MIERHAHRWHAAYLRRQGELGNGHHASLLVPAALTLTLFFNDMYRRSRQTGQFARNEE